MSHLAGAVHWLGHEWKWLVSTALALYGAALGLANKRRQDRAEQRELEREKHQLQIRTGLASDQKGEQPPLLRVILTNLGFRPITLLKVELSTRAKDGEFVGFDHDRVQFPPRIELPHTLAPDDPPVVFRYPLHEIKATFTHVVVTNSHGIKHDWQLPDEFVALLDEVRAGETTLLDEHKRLLIERARDALPPSDG